ncbi:TRM11 family SAM-dependent methyltransferase [Actinokineospora diospyrosa]|uniref:Methyltransferase n=1 Tax=Actinokineospora diospyrosa TaxID=103728 RepID=A0ABT1I9H3_9PSEU|nr:DNA methyltransferase [Actinokineospora diospyrosa]MCP2269208.1 DNA methylase [Actinokineospora diospyrosa]
MTTVPSADPAHHQEAAPVTQAHATPPVHDTVADPADEPTLPIPRDLINALDTRHPTTDDPADDPLDERPEAVSVWTTAQTSPVTQRKNKYVPASTAHPAKMLPEVARHAITHYTRPGDLVLDPMCGIGTTLVEAVRLGRRAVGVEYKPHWVEVAKANLDGARSDGVVHDARVFQGDARQLVTLLPPEYVGQAALVVTSPPYGPSTHGQVSVGPGEGVQKYHHRYGNTLDRGNLANVGHHRLLAGFTRILFGLRTFLRPGGHIAITIRPWREHSELIDLPAQILACGVAAGLIPVERNVALLARAAETDFVARGSFFQRDFIRKQREAGLPLHLIAHEDVLVFRTALTNTDDTATADRTGDVQAPSTPAAETTPDTRSRWT